MYSYRSADRDDANLKSFILSQPIGSVIEATGDSSVEGIIPLFLNYEAKDSDPSVLPCALLITVQNEHRLLHFW